LSQQVKLLGQFGGLKVIKGRYTMTASQIALICLDMAPRPNLVSMRSRSLPPGVL